MGERKKWTKEEERILIENYEIKGGKYCAENLSRSLTAIRRRAKILGLTTKIRKKEYGEEFLSKIINESRNISEVLDKLGLRKAGGNFKTIKKYIERYDLDTSHFTISEVSIKNLKKTKKPLSEILLKNSTYNRDSLKKRLISEGFLEYECVECGLGETWNKKPISLQLDHINGDPHDNRIENLRFLCPNCHSQTNTFAGKSRQKKNGEKVDKRTLGLDRPNQRKVERPNKTELIKLLENNTYTKVGKIYGVSDNAVRKWAKRYCII